jgi:hypothetical protein
MISKPDLIDREKLLEKLALIDLYGGTGGIEQVQAIVRQAPSLSPSPDAGALETGDNHLEYDEDSDDYALFFIRGDGDHAGPTFNWRRRDLEGLRDIIARALAAQAGDATGEGA